ncbi:MAG TPA: zinc-ribbon domain-containing protein [Anaeromyxobacteraceae bacterium]|nr:zinc-ribbon domain-containing protein [Anaeromyxobacteraceae bacterium]
MVDVRCERCRAQYAFDEAEVSEAGLTVRCSKCSHVFVVRKKALVVTSPIKPGSPAAAPVEAADLQRRSAGAAHTAARPWVLRKPSGEILPVKDLAVLQRWIVERKARREDDLSKEGTTFARLGSLAEFEPFFSLVDRAGSPSDSPPMSPAANPVGSQSTLTDFPLSPASPRQEMAGGAPASKASPDGPRAASGLGVPREEWGAPARGTGAPEPAWADPGRAVLRSPPAPAPRPRKLSSRRRRGLLAPVIALTLTAGAGTFAIYVFQPGLFAWVSSKLRRIASPRAELSAPAAEPESPPPADTRSSGNSPSPSEAAATPPPEPPPAASEPSAASADANGKGTEPARPRSPPKISAQSPARAGAEPSPSPAHHAKQESKKPRGDSMKALLSEAYRLRERGKPEAALSMYDHALDQNPHDAEILSGRGLCYLDLSQYALAEASFRAALEVDARHGGALMGLAETYRYEGRRGEAVSYYKKYLAAHPQGEDAVAAANAVEALKE